MINYIILNRNQLDKIAQDITEAEDGEAVEIPVEFPLAALKFNGPAGHLLGTIKLMVVEDEERRKMRAGLISMLSGKTVAYLGDDGTLYEVSMPVSDSVIGAVFGPDTCREPWEIKPDE